MFKSDQQILILYAPLFLILNKTIHLVKHLQKTKKVPKIHYFRHQVTSLGGFEPPATCLGVLYPLFFRLSLCIRKSMKKRENKRKTEITFISYIACSYAILCSFTDSYQQNISTIFYRIFETSGDLSSILYLYEQAVPLCCLFVLRK